MAFEHILELIESKAQQLRMKMAPPPEEVVLKPGQKTFYELHIEKIDVIKSSNVILDLKYAIEAFFKKVNIRYHDLLENRHDSETLRYALPIEYGESAGNALFSLWINPNTIDEYIKIKLDISGTIDQQELTFSKEIKMHYKSFNTQTIETMVLEGMEKLVDFLITNI